MGEESLLIRLSLRPGLTRFEVGPTVPLQRHREPLIPKSIYTFGALRGHGAEGDAVPRYRWFGRLQLMKLSETIPTQLCEWPQTPLADKTLLLRFQAKAPLDTGLQSGTQSSVGRAQSSAIGAPRTQSNNRSVGG